MCFSVISSSNVEKHNAFQRFQAQILKNTMFSMISHQLLRKHNVFNDFISNIKAFVGVNDMPLNVILK